MPAAGPGQNSLPLLLAVMVAIGGCAHSLSGRHLVGRTSQSVLHDSDGPGSPSDNAAAAVPRPEADPAPPVVQDAPAAVPLDASPTGTAEIVTTAAVEESEADPGIDLPSHTRDAELVAVPIDLTTALAVATGRNPQVAFAHERIREAVAELESAEILWLPSLRAGLNYHVRDGNIQNTEGKIIDSHRSAFFAGLGSRAVGGGSVGVPGVWAEFHLSDALFQPRIADHTAMARRRGAQVMLNDTLLTVAVAYLGLLRAVQELSISQETLDHTLELARATESFADAGLIPQGDVDRAYTEVSIRRNAVQQSRERVQVASSRLVRWLSGEPATLLVPQEPTVFPVEFVSPDLEIRVLVETGLLQRPELAENRELVAEAIERLNRERFSPLLPSVVLGVTCGALGGSPGPDLTDFRDRIDVDVAAWWEVRQFGLGERANRRTAQSRIDQARWQQVQLMDLIMQEIMESAAQVRLRREQLPVAEEGIRRAIDSHRRNMQRIRQGEGLPLEALHSVGALDQARREYLRTVIEFNEAQFRLQRGLGWPVK